MNKISKRIAALILSVIMCIPSVFINIAYAADITGWTVEYMGSCDADVTVDDEVTYAGNGALKVVNRSPAIGNVYVTITQSVPVEAGKKYYVGAKMKFDKASSVNMMINWDWNTNQSITRLGSTIDWTNIKWMYTATATQKVVLRVNVEGTGTAWFDNFIFEDVETGVNLLKNSTFDAGDVKTSTPSASDSSEDAYAKVTGSGSFSQSDMEAARGAIKYIPVYRADKITIDADTSDWDGITPVNMPVHSGQFVIYAKDEKPIDNKAVYKFAHDDTYFYVMAEITDDEHVYYEGSGNYWKGDSLQMAVGDILSTFGTEVGIALDPDAGKCDVYGISRTDNENVLSSGRREGNKTIYELAFPWDCWFSQAVNEMYVSVAMNDNDAGTRRYCMELAPGIAEGKYNDQYPKLEMLNETDAWYGFIQSKTRAGYVGEKYNYDYYIVNTSDETKKFKITDYNNKTKEFEIAAHSGIRDSFSVDLEEQKIIYPGVTVECDGRSKTINDKMDVRRKLPSKEYSLEVAGKIEKYANKLNNLLKQCEEEGISTDYEIIAYRILDRYIDFINMDLRNNNYNRIYYLEEATAEVYKDAKARLESYLKGTETPIEVPRYISNPASYDGVAIYADNIMPDGSIERRPTIFSGSAHGNYTAVDAPTFNEWGFNAQELELGLSNSQTYISGWCYTVYGSPEASITSEKEIKHSGERSMKMEFTSPIVANYYYQVNNHIDVEPNTTYTLKGYVKGENSGGIDISMMGWSALNTTPTGTFDWKEYSVSYTTSATQTELYLMFILAKPGVTYLDDFQLINETTGEDILYNGGFEEAVDGELPKFDPHCDDVKRFLKRIKVNEESNNAVSVLLGPTYFSPDLITKYGIKHSGPGFLNYNVNSPVAKELMEDYVRGLIPLIKDFKNIICVEVINEPQLWFDMCGDFYLDDWHKFLESRWDSIEELNKSYGTNYSSFNDIPMERDWKNPALTYDFVEFNNIVFGGWQNWVADIIHEIWPEAKVGAKIMGYTSDIQRTNLLGMGTNIEYTTSYDINICDYWDYHTDERKELVGEMWYDYMTSVNDAPVINTEDHVYHDGTNDWTNHLDAPHGERNLYMGTIHGRTGTVQWIWGYQYPVGNQVWGNLMYRPAAMYRIEQASLDANRLAPEITSMAKETTDVGILYSNASMWGDITAMPACYRAYETLIYSGKNTKFVVDSRKESMHNYKMMIVPNAKYVKADVLEELKKYIQNGGKVLIIGKDSLKKNEKNIENDTETVKYIYDNSEVIDFEGKRDAIVYPTVEELTEIINKDLEALSLKYAEVIDAETGEPTEKVEFDLGVCDGKVIFNLCNFGEDRKVKVKLNGEIISKAKELRSMKDVGESIELIYNKPITLEIETDNPFFDTYSHWGEEEITKLYQKGITNGVSVSRYSPDSQITEAEFLAMTLRSLNVNEKSYSKSDDVNWYDKTLRAAKEPGIIGENEIVPEKPIEREKMCVILYRAYQKILKQTVEANEMGFTDKSQINDKESVSAMNTLDVVRGYEDNTFRPHDTATRAEAAAMINRFSDLK